MKLSESIFCLGLLVTGCGGSSAPPPASANSQTSPAASAMMDHSEHMAMPSASSSEPSAAPLSSANPTTSAAKTSPNTTDKSGSAPLGGSAGTPAAKGNITITVSSTPANAAKSAVVYLEDAPKDRDVNGTLDNRQMAFIPHVLVVTAGAKITFSNSDPFPHNVFSPDNEKWDMGMIPAHGTRVRKFEKPGTYTVLCNVHPNMKAYIVVVPSSYFAKSDKSGEFVIHDVPAGKYKLVAWGPSVKGEQQEIAVDGDKTVAFELHR